jgi:hypothetical protein
MFVRADLLLKDAVPEMNRKHVVHFGWEDFDPVLLVYDHRTDKTERLELDRLDWSLSEAKWCVGSFGEGGYRPCVHAREVTKFDQCSECASSWIPVQSCIYEPQCDGSRCESRICKREHTVYLAFFGSKAKIGMTTSRRLRERGIEQGADAIAPLVRKENRLEGRRAENDISKALRLPQLMQKRKVLEEQCRIAKAERLEEVYRSYLATLSSRMDVLDAELEVLDQYPLKDLGGRIPQLVDATGKHRGRALGSKGKFLFYEDHLSKLNALELADLPGRHLGGPAKRY